MSFESEVDQDYRFYFGWINLRYRIGWWCFLHAKDSALIAPAPVPERLSKSIPSSRLGVHLSINAATASRVGFQLSESVPTQNLDLDRLQPSSMHAGHTRAVEQNGDRYTSCEQTASAEGGFNSIENYRQLLNAPPTVVGFKICIAGSERIRDNRESILQYATLICISVSNSSLAWESCHIRKLKMLCLMEGRDECMSQCGKEESKRLTSVCPRISLGRTLIYMW